MAGLGRFLPIDLVAGHHHLEDHLEGHRDRLDIVAVEVVQDSASGALVSGCAFSLYHDMTSSSSWKSHTHIATLLTPRLETCWRTAWVGSVGRGEFACKLLSIRVSRSLEGGSGG